MALEVLVIDDEQDIRELVGGVLEDEGYQTRSAADRVRDDLLVDVVGSVEPEAVIIICETRK